MVDGLCPNRKSRIRAREFAKIFQVIIHYILNLNFVFNQNILVLQFGNEKHMQKIKDMGIIVTKLPNGLPLLFMNSSHVFINFLCYGSEK